MFHVLLLSLICVAVSSGQLRPALKCSQLIEPGLTMEDVCRRVPNRVCVEKAYRAECECEDAYKSVQGACIPRTCSDTFPNSKVKLSDVCEFIGRECRNSSNSPSKCVCKRGFKWDEFSNCVAETCDEKVKGRSMTWKQTCEMDSMTCLDSVFFGPTCVLKSCEDTIPVTAITWKQHCATQNNNMMCFETPGGVPYCDCRIAFKNVNGTCRAKACSEPVLMGITPNDICQVYAPKLKCMTSTAKGPECVCADKFRTVTNGSHTDCAAKTCTDIRTGIQTWNVYCSSLPNKECSDHLIEGPDCVCKQGYKEYSGACKVQTCDERPEGSPKTFREACEEVPNQICDDKDSRMPTCICKPGFLHNRTGSCLPNQCTDVVTGLTLTYEFKCQPQKCIVSPVKGPICLVKTCKDLKEKNITYEKFCESNTNMVCEEIENSVPLCKCKKGYKTPPGGGTYDCVGQDCSDLHELGVTWDEFCAKDPKRQCSKVTEPSCTCKPGFHNIHLHDCEQIYCPNLTMPQNATPGAQCSQIKAGNGCQVSCAHGFEPSPKIHRCNWSGAWDTNVTSCKKIVDTLCPELLPPQNGSLEGTCKSARPKSVCKFNCNPGFLTYQADGTFNDLTCTKSGEWSLPTPFCVDKCDIHENNWMCKQDNAECYNDRINEDVSCQCKSPYLVWKKGKGCQYQKHGYYVTLEGLKLNITNSPRKMQADSGKANPEDSSPSYLEIIFLFLEGLRTILTLEHINHVSLVQQGNTGLWKWEIIMFFQQPVSIEFVELLFVNSPCQIKDDEGYCVYGPFAIRPQDIQRIKVRVPEPVCKTDLHQCPVGSKCVQNLENPMAFTCACDRRKFSTVHQAIHEDPNRYNNVVCEYKSSGSQNSGSNVSNSTVVVGAVLGVLLFCALCAVAVLVYRLKKRYI